MGRRRTQGLRVRSELQEKVVPRTGLTESPQIKWLQGKIGLAEARSQFLSKPPEQTRPITADSKRLGNRLAADVRLVVPQRPEKHERASGVAALGETKRAKHLGLRQQTSRRMEETHGAGEPSSRRVALPRDELRCLPQPSYRRQDQNQPGPAAHKSRAVWDQKPRYAGYDQHRQGRKAPGSIQSALPPGLGQHDQRRDTRDEKQDVIEVH